MCSVLDLQQTTAPPLCCTLSHTSVPQPPDDICTSLPVHTQPSKPSNGQHAPQPSSPAALADRRRTPVIPLVVTKNKCFLVQKHVAWFRCDVLVVQSTKPSCSWLNLTEPILYRQISTVPQSFSLGTTYNITQVETVRAALSCQTCKTTTQNQNTAALNTLSTCPPGPTTLDHSSCNAAVKSVTLI